MISKIPRVFNKPAPRVIPKITLERFGIKVMGAKSKDPPKPTTNPGNPNEEKPPEKDPPKPKEDPKTQTKKEILENALKNIKKNIQKNGTAVPQSKKRQLSEVSGYGSE